MNTYKKVFIVCAAISFALSLSFWLFLGVFQLFGFIIWSLVPAAFGLLKFYGIQKVLQHTKWRPEVILRCAWSGAIVACIVLRLAIFVYAVYILIAH